MRKFASLLLAGGALWAQDLPPAAGAGLVPAAPVVLENVGKPMVTPFRCTEEDIRSAGLTCSEQDPCPVYLELAAVESTGIRIFAAGNIHTANATLYTILLGSEDNGQTWREVYERVPGAALDHIQFADVATGWTSGLAFGPLPEDIIGAGIKKVYYIEPYPKSRAQDLHNDAICFDEAEARKTGKIPFLPFIGIGPRRYLDLFSLDLSSGREIKRKGDDGKPILPNKTDSPPRVPMVALSYLEREDKLLEEFKDILRKLQGVRHGQNTIEGPQLAEPDENSSAGERKG